jgi:hypothetical protein
MKRDTKHHDINTFMKHVLSTASCEEVTQSNTEGSGRAAARLALSAYLHLAQGQVEHSFC